MARKKYMAIHTFHSDEIRKAFWRGLHKSELPDFERRDGYIFEKCQCTGTWVGDDDFFFCQWESESEEDVLKALTSKEWMNIFSLLFIRLICTLTSET